MGEGEETPRAMETNWNAGTDGTALTLAYQAKGRRHSTPALLRASDQCAAMHIRRLSPGCCEHTTVGGCTRHVTCCFGVL